MFNINYYKNNQIDNKLKQYIQTKNQKYILQLMKFYTPFSYQFKGQRFIL